MREILYLQVQLAIYCWRRRKCYVHSDSTPASAYQVLPGIGRAEERAIPETVRIRMPLAIDLPGFSTSVRYSSRGGVRGHWLTRFRIVI
jgi:hypothetical protein